MNKSSEKVVVEDKFWKSKIDINRKVTLPTEYSICEKTGRLGAFKLDWKPGKSFEPHCFWDSDTAKWMEAAAYSLGTHPDAKLEKQLDNLIDDIAKAQAPDGYLNTYFQTHPDKKRWSNLGSMHELYCAGHLMEAAVAYFETTGKRKFLDIMCRYADHIDSVFGSEKGKLKGYPGHEEIELALVKLYKASGQKKYLKLAEFFINERGQSPNYFVEERKKLGIKESLELKTLQAHLPVREQKDAEGHAVRAVYLYSGMADLALEKNEESLKKACRALWKNITEKRMYITGGIGSSRQGERFSYDYDLPNEEAYAETCAAIGLFLFSRRMLKMDSDAKYADVMEQALYNGILSGVSLDGKHFFYENPLEVTEKASAFYQRNYRSGEVKRQEWFYCACCPPNIARLFASLHHYIYETGENTVSVNLYIGSSLKTEIGGTELTVEQKTNYPWEGEVGFKFKMKKSLSFKLRLRIPAWSKDAGLKINGKKVSIKLQKGYAVIERKWNDKDVVELSLPMPVELIEANPAVRHDCGKTAIMRGPLVYCLEEEDNGKNLNDITITDFDFKAKFEKNLMDGIVTIGGKGSRRKNTLWKEKLYKPLAPELEKIKIKAVPYAYWANRKAGNMIVWIKSL